MSYEEKETPAGAGNPRALEGTDESTRSNIPTEPPRTPPTGTGTSTFVLVFSCTGAGTVTLPVAPGVNDNVAPPAYTPDTPGDSITILVHGSALATKRWFLGAGGKKECEAYGEGKYFRAETIPLRGLEDLYDLLGILAVDPKAFVIRGELIPGRDPGRVRRTKKTRERDPPGFREVARRWLVVDVDGAKVPGVDLSTQAGCQAAADAVLGLLPRELRSAGHIWQFSSSAGLKPGLHCHLWFWLDRPMGETDLTTWGQNVNDSAGWKLLDLVVFRTIQPLYVADPLFENIVDPVAQRMGYVPGVPASLPRPGKRGWLDKLAPLKDPDHKGFHECLLGACNSYFYSHGPDVDGGELFAALRAHRDVAEELQGRHDPKYNDDGLRAQMEDSRAWARGHALIHDDLVCGENGTPKPTVANVTKILQGSPEWADVLAFNSRSLEVTLMHPPPFPAVGPFPRPLGLHESVKICTWLQDTYRMGTGTDVVQEVVKCIADEVTYDPVRQYLEHLPQWDGVERVDAMWITYGGAQDCEYTRVASRIWMIGAVARAFAPGCKFDTMLVLQGTTGFFKTTALNVLAGGDGWHVELDLQFDGNKDEIQHIHGPWIIEVGEMGGMGRADLNHVKQFITRTMDRFRAPYDTNAANHPRTCALAATANPEQCIPLDLSGGARRFLPIQVTRYIDCEAIEVGRDQLWGEALHQYRAGVEWWVDAHHPAFVEVQARHTTADSWREEVAAILLLGRSGTAPGGHFITIPPNPEWVAVGDILTVMGNPPMRQTANDQSRVAAILRNRGYTKAQQHHRVVWRRPIPRG